VNRNEGVHSMLRDRLHRLRHRTEGYTKSVSMLAASIAMICVRSGWSQYHPELRAPQRDRWCDWVQASVATADDVTVQDGSRRCAC
jgi:hypothetical protein